MKISLKNILIIIGIILAIFLTFKVTQYFYEKKIEKNALEQRKEIIANDSLVKLTETEYQKLVADTNTIADLKKLTDSLKIQVKNPEIVERIKVVVKTDTFYKPAEESTFTDSTYTLTDYSPSKDNYFVKYTSNIDFKNKKDSGIFEIKPIDISVAIEEVDGLYRANIKVPEYLSLEDYNIQSTPLYKKKPDNFDWVAGAGYFNNLGTGEQGAELDFGIKVLQDYSLIGNIRTDKPIGAKLLISF